MLNKFRKFVREFKLSMRMKLILGCSAIAVILLTSSIISIMEYHNMSNYVSELIAGNINSINVAQKLANDSNAYNLELLAIVGDEERHDLPDFDQDGFMANCDSLRKALRVRDMAHLADSVEYSYSAYMLTSLELPQVLESDFIDTRTWYFNRLQPVYGRLRGHLDAMTSNIYNELRKNSATFERGFYRSIIPGAVAVAVGIVLVLLLLFYLMVYYVNPIYKMVSGLNNYKSVGKSYGYDFEGNDQLKELNDGIIEITGENTQLRKRVKDLREAIKNSNNV